MSNSKLLSDGLSFRICENICLSDPEYHNHLKNELSDFFSRFDRDTIISVISYLSETYSELVESKMKRKDHMFLFDFLTDDIEVFVSFYNSLSFYEFVEFLNFCESHAYVDDDEKIYSFKCLYPDIYQKLFNAKLNRNDLSDVKDGE